MALTKISTGGVKDDAASQAKIADEAIDEARLQISNAGSNGQFLSKQSGNTGGLTWATPPDTNTQVGGSTGVDFNDDVKARFGTANDLEIHHDGSSYGFITNNTGDLVIKNDNSSTNAIRIRSKGDEEDIVCNANGAVEVYFDNTKRLETTAAGVTVTGSVTDDKGNLRDIPYNLKNDNYTLVAADRGKVVGNSVASKTTTIPTSVFGTGQVVSIINPSSGDHTIAAGSGFTLINTADAATGNRTLASKGLATIWFTSASEGYISGAGLS